jgi:hypothetical protein
MTMEWYFLTCPACRARLRIKAAYTSMRGRCPVCNLRIEPPIPKPLKLGGNGLIPEDEEWPEPASVIEETSTSTEATYDVSTGAVAAAPPKKEEEVQVGGTYSFAFEADAPKTPGISRSAEWEQGQGSAPDRPAEPVRPIETAPVVVSEIAKPALEPPVSEAARPAEPERPVVYETVVDPLFGDEVKVAKPVAAEEAKPASPTPPLMSLQPPPVPPVARFAPAAEVVSPPTKPKVRREPKPRDDEEPIELPKIKRAPPPVAPALGSPHAPRSQAKAPAEDETEEPVLDPTEQARYIYRLSQAEENRIKPDPPPKSVFLDGVFDMPWQPGNRAVWFWLSVGFSMLLLIGWLMNILLGMGQWGLPGIAALGMSALWVSVWTFTYACAGLLNVVTYTAAGSRTVRWPDEPWREQFPYLLKVGYYYIIALAIGSLANFIGLGVYGWSAVTLFLFPMFLFSGMASMSFWNFIHGDVMKSVREKFPQYLIFYGLSLAVWVPVNLLAAFSIFYVWLIPLAGPAFAAAWLIYSRLLGRMAYVLQGQPKKRKRRKKKQVEEAEEAAPPAPPTAPRADPEKPIPMAMIEGEDED